MRTNGSSHTKLDYCRGNDFISRVKLTCLTLGGKYGLLGPVYLIFKVYTLTLFYLIDYNILRQ